MLPLVGRRLALQSSHLSRGCAPNRTIFGIFGGVSSSGASNRGQQYHERKILPYRQQQLYELVADVDSYHHFVPYCTSSRVLKKSRKSSESVNLEAELKVGFLGFEEKYISHVECRPYEMVQAVASAEIPLFQSLVTTWRFQPASSSSPHPTADLVSTLHKSGSTVDGPTMLTFDLEYVFANPLHAHVSAAFFGQMSKIMVKAFEERCLEVYGPGIK